MVEMKNKRLNVAASVSGRGDYRGGYKWKRRLPASSFGAVMRSTAGGGDRVADQILNNTCEDIIIYDMLICSKECLTRPQP